MEIAVCSRTKLHVFTVKILQICHKMPYPTLDGGSYSLLSTALGLVSLGIDVHVLALNTPKNWIDQKQIPTEIQESIHLHTVQVDTRIKPFKAIRYLFSKHPYFVTRFKSELFRNKLIQLLEKEQFDMVQLEHLYLTGYIETIRKYSDARIILRPQNVEFQIWEGVMTERINPLLKFYLKIEVPKLRRMEIKTMRRLDGILAIAPHDEELFRSFAPQVQVRFVPIGFNFAKISQFDQDKQYWQFPVFYHLGSMDWIPNIQGLKWFILHVIPEIRKVYPEFILRIAGKKMPSWFFENRGDIVVIDGMVPDAIAYQEDKAILVVPLHSGGGLRVKIIEAMALGKTVISTTLGAKGIPYTPGKNILIADTHEIFVKHVLACKNSPEFCKEIGGNAYQLAKDHYDLNTIAGQMVSFYNSIK